MRDQSEIDQLRTLIFDRLLLIIVVMCMLTAAVGILYDIWFSDFSVNLYAWLSSLAIASLITRQIQRRHPTLVQTGMVVLFILFSIFADYPTALLHGRSSFFVFIPVVVAGLLWPKWCTLALAGGEIAVYIALTTLVSTTESVNVPQMLGLLLVALIVSESRELSDRAFSRVIDRERLLHAIADISNMLSSTLPIDKLLNQVADLVSERFGCSCNLSLSPGEHTVERTVFPLQLGDTIIGTMSIRRDKGELDTNVQIALQALCEQMAVAIDRTRTHDRYREIVDMQSELIVQFRPDGTITYANPAFNRFFDDDPIEKHILQEMGVTESWEDVLSLLKASDMRSYPEYQVFSRGKARWIEFSSRRIDGVYQVVGRDVTERVQMERNLKAAEEQLYQAQKMDALGRMAAGVAHDFNNYLAAIDGGVDLIRRRCGQDMSEDIDYLDTAVSRARELVQHLVSYSCRRQGTIEPLYLGESIRGISSFLRRMSDVEIKVDCDPVGPILTSRTQIDQILLNLVTNSRDAGATRIHISVSENDGQARLSVSDNGPGMSEAQFEHIFEPFWTSKTDGGGLGLSTVYSVVSQMGGQIHVANHPGNGMVYTIDLPVTGGAHGKDHGRGRPPANSGGSEKIASTSTHHC